jgi:hypothetical protein
MPVGISVYGIARVEILKSRRFDFTQEQIRNSPA